MLTNTSVHCKCSELRVCQEEKCFGGKKHGGWVLTSAGFPIWIQHETLQAAAESRLLGINTLVLTSVVR